MSDSNANGSSRTVEPSQLAQKLAAGGCEVLDVRTPVEYQEFHIRGAKLVPLDELDVGKFMASRSDPAAPLYVVCRSGGRGAKAMGKFRDAGHENVFNVAGGTLACEQAGIPIERSKMKVISLERQVRLVAGLLVLTGVGLGTAVHPGYYGIAAFIGAGLTFSGLTGFCGMALLLAKAPWNRVDASCCGSKTTCKSGGAS